MDQDAKEMFGKAVKAAVKINEEVIMEFVKQARIWGIPVLVACSEADAQLVALYRQGHIDFIVSEDMDFVIQGCDMVFNLRSEETAFLIAIVLRLCFVSCADR